METFDNSNDNEFAASPWGETGTVEDVPSVKTESRLDLMKKFISQTEAHPPKSYEAAKRFAGFCRNVAIKCVTFMRQAFEIALMKFCVEFGAMIVAGVAGAMVAKVGKPLEISTPGVFWSTQSPTNQLVASNQSGSQKTFDPNPFSEWNNAPVGRNNVSPW